MNPTHFIQQTHHPEIFSPPDDHFLILPPSSSLEERVNLIATNSLSVSNIPNRIENSDLELSQSSVVESFHLVPLSNIDDDAITPAESFSSLQNQIFSGLEYREDTIPDSLLSLLEEIEERNPISFTDFHTPLTPSTNPPSSFSQTSTLPFASTPNAMENLDLGPSSIVESFHVAPISSMSDDASAPTEQAFSSTPNQIFNHAGHTNEPSNLLDPPYNETQKMVQAYLKWNQNKMAYTKKLACVFFKNFDSEFQNLTLEEIEERYKEIQKTGKYSCLIKELNTIRNRWFHYRGNRHLAPYSLKLDISNRWGDRIKKIFNISENNIFSFIENYIYPIYNSYMQSPVKIKSKRIPKKTPLVIENLSIEPNQLLNQGEHIPNVTENLDLGPSQNFNHVGYSTSSNISETPLNTIPKSSKKQRKLRGTKGIYIKLMTLVFLKTFEAEFQNLTLKEIEMRLIETEYYKYAILEKELKKIQRRWWAHKNYSEKTPYSLELDITKRWNQSIKKVFNCKKSDILSFIQTHISPIFKTYMQNSSQSEPRKISNRIGHNSSSSNSSSGSSQILPITILTSLFLKKFDPEFRNLKYEQIEIKIKEKMGKNEFNQKYTFLEKKMKMLPHRWNQKRTNPKRFYDLKLNITKEWKGIKQIFNLTDSTEELDQLIEKDLFPIYNAYLERTIDLNSIIDSINKNSSTVSPISNVAETPTPAKRGKKRKRIEKNSLPTKKRKKIKYRDAATQTG